MYENNKHNSNSHKKFNNNKKKNYKKNKQNNNNKTQRNKTNNYHHNNNKHHQQNNKKNHNNKKKNYKHYNNKKTIEEYEKIYIEKRMKEAGDKPLCPICNEPIYIIEEAIRHNSSGEYAHFECIVNEIKTENIDDIEKDEKIVYLGAGTFGIIQEKQGGKNTKFSVKKRINYENRKIKKINDDSDPEEDDLFNV